MSERRALDVSTLPTFAFGHRSVMWWGLASMMVIEGTMFALLIATYIYLGWREPKWPPGVFPPVLLWGTVNTLLMLVSLVPNELTKRATERLDLPALRLWLVVCIGFAVAIAIVRILEFPFLNVWWDTNAYGSIVWMLLGMHTAHLVTDLYDTIVVTVLMFTGPIEGTRYVDVSENALYWYFVVLSWMPVYAVIYLAPRYF